MLRVFFAFLDSPISPLQEMTYCVYTQFSLNARTTVTERPELLAHAAQCWGGSGEKPSKSESESGSVHISRVPASKKEARFALRSNSEPFRVPGEALHPRVQQGIAPRSGGDRDPTHLAAPGRRHQLPERVRPYCEVAPRGSTWTLLPSPFQGLACGEPWTGETRRRRRAGG